MPESHAEVSYHSFYIAFFDTCRKKPLPPNSVPFTPVWNFTIRDNLFNYRPVFGNSLFLVTQLPACGLGRGVWQKAKCTGLERPALGRAGADPRGPGAGSRGGGSETERSAAGRRCLGQRYWNSTYRLHVSVSHLTVRTHHICSGSIVFSFTFQANAVLFCVYVSSGIKVIHSFWKWNSALFTRMGREEEKERRDPARFEESQTVCLIIWK